MTSRDLHSSPRTQIIASKEQGLRLRLAKLQWGKDDVGFSLHASPSSFSTYGVQQTDLLSYLGFGRMGCPFLNGDGYCKWTNEDFDIEGFSGAFERCYSYLKQAQSHLEACGFALPQPEGFGHFYGKPSTGAGRRLPSARGDGHTSPVANPMKTAEDTAFRYTFTWIEAGQDKGWTTHYRPKHEPISPEIVAAFESLALQRFAACPEFDFEPCFWRFTPFSPQVDGGFGNADYAHRYFDANAIAFSAGVEELLAANALVEPFGMGFLPLAKPPEKRRAEETVKRVGQPQKRKPLTDSHDFDAAISFAGTDRGIAERLATRLRDAGYVVFYDNFFPEQLWGVNLIDFFDDIYRRKARYCVILVSADYVEREWTNHERQSAQARRMKEKGSDYVLPLKVDDTELPGMPPTVGYISLQQYTVDQVADMLIKKLGKPGKE